MSEQTEVVEQFEGFTPEGAPPAEQELDTFGNTEPIETPKQETKPQEEVKKEVKDEKGEEDDPKQTMDSADELEEKEAGKETEKEDKEEPAKPEAKDSNDEGEGDGKEEDTPRKPEGKTIRLKTGDGSVDVEEDATVAVKIDGKKQFVPLSELRSNYSGKQSWDKKFGELESTKQQFTAEKTKFEDDKKVVVEHFTRIGDKLNAIYDDPSSDPVDALRYLVDTSGKDVLKFEQRMMAHYGNLAADFAEMSEAEQQLYWSERKNQILLDNQANRAKIDSDRTAQEQRIQAESEVRKQYGVSDRDFEEAQNELVQLGYDVSKVDAKGVCEFISLKPHAEKAEAICEQFQEDLGDDDLVNLISETTKTLRDNSFLSPEEAVKLAGRRLGFEIEDINDDIDELNKKVAKPESRLEADDNSAKKAGKKRESGHVESFDDYENDIYNYG